MPQNATDSAGKLSFGKAIFIYALGGIVGTVWETLLNLFRGRGFVFCNGSILTPFNFVYGTGALVIILLLKNKKKLWQVFITGALGGRRSAKTGRPRSSGPALNTRVCGGTSAPKPPTSGVGNIGSRADLPQNAAPPGRRTGTPYEP